MYETTYVVKGHVMAIIEVYNQNYTNLSIILLVDGLFILFCNKHYAVIR